MSEAEQPARSAGISYQDLISGDVVPPPRPFTGWVKMNRGRMRRNWAC
ncbi:MAG: hypothetical protein QF921_18130 [Pseudomonadales bacterium]|nr:hypothetical protein [Pseudomonadales bacterium]MDP6470461.1 hypothetical protein [Pseudomonadales bacterium]MDP6827763.1 hypothetical protein [Pseudomonadales bacterium]MDP6973405.1 hypothetical protein [Pseudomonadales bacterium]|tara:strand:- start:4008 stop:4151 length:144 start_codon:yes stop_codon:yes gene_type:complete